MITNTATLKLSFKIKLDWMKISKSKYVFAVLDLSQSN